jgi:hypothetical protein
MTLVKNPVSDSCTGIQETGFFSEIKGLRFFATLRMTLGKNPVSGFRGDSRNRVFQWALKLPGLGLHYMTPQIPMMLS